MISAGVSQNTSISCPNLASLKLVQWPYSSFAGYARKSKRVNWIQYDLLHSYWNASVGGKNPDTAYRTYIKEGLNGSVDPFKSEPREWVFVSL